MFDAHYINRKYSRKLQRKAQIIRSRLQNPIDTIDYNLVPMYRAFLERNPQYTQQPILNGVLRSIPGTIGSRILKAPRIEDSDRPRPAYAYIPNNMDTPTEILLPEILAQNTTLQLVPDNANLPNGYHQLQSFPITHSSSTTYYRFRLFYFESEHSHNFALLPLFTQIADTTGINITAIIPSFITGLVHAEDSMPVHYIEFDTSIARPTVRIAAQHTLLFPDPLDLMEITCPDLSVAGSPLGTSLLRFSFFSLSKNSFS